MTAIEELWEHAKTDQDTQLVNGSLMRQATYICTACGHEMGDTCLCTVCGNSECDDGS